VTYKPQTTGALMFARLPSNVIFPSIKRLLTGIALLAMKV